MNITDDKVSGINKITLTNSLKGTLLYLKLSLNNTTTIPDSNNLIIYVDKEDNDNPSNERKEFVFELDRPLSYYNEVSDEFYLKLEMNNSKIIDNSLILRKILNNSILDNAEEEALEYQNITLFEGINYLYTNYDNINIEVIYPKNNDLNNRYVTYNSLYNLSLDNKDEDNYFTVTDDLVNLELNNLNVSCITSTNNKFNLDSNGNLTVNSIIANEGIINNEGICNLIYPVGSLYFSINNTNPSTLFGGTWVNFGEGKTLIGVDQNDPNFNNSLLEGGEKEHTLSVEEMPSHSHNEKLPDSYRIGVSGGAGAYLSDATNPSTPYAGSCYDSAYTTTNTGSSTPHNNLPPYITVFIFKRIS